jgi:two-component system LytT family response regulator
MIRVAIIDDEPMARKIIRNYLQDESGIDIIGECKNGMEALKFIKQRKPDLIFLDVQMPGMNGFEVLARLNVKALPAVIFVTAYEDYAIDAFENHALDYLLKPFSRKRFTKALDYARGQFTQRTLKTTGSDLAKFLREIGDESRYLSRLSIRINDRILILPVQEISWFEANGTYVRLHAGEKSYLCREHLNTLEARLDPGKFMRIHRSTLVRIDTIRELQRWFHREFVIILKDGTRLKSGRNYSEKIKALL